MHKFYAGVGSRTTPEPILKEMERLASVAATNGWWLRTGNAKGADQAFAKGANAVDPSKVILYLPWPSYEKQAIVEGNRIAKAGSLAKAHEIVWKLHPLGKKLEKGPLTLHARNVFILLGKDLDKPVAHVICWTPKGLPFGGTGMAIRIAEEYKIPVINLGA